MELWEQQEEERVSFRFKWQDHLVICIRAVFVGMFDVEVFSFLLVDNSTLLLQPGWRE